MTYQVFSTFQHSNLVAVNANFFLRKCHFSKANLKIPPKSSLFSAKPHFNCKNALNENDKWHKTIYET